MDNDLYQKLLHQVVYKENYPHNTSLSEQVEKVAHYGKVDEGTSCKFSIEFNKRRFGEFGPKNLHDAINSLNTRSTNMEFLRFQARFTYRTDDPQKFEIHIRTPDNKIRTYTVKREWAMTYSYRDVKGGVYYLLSEHGIPDDTPEVIVPQIVTALKPLGTEPLIFVPIGVLHHEDGETEFALVHLLCKQQLALIYDYPKSDEPVEGRKAPFPGVEGEISVASLVGDFEIGDGLDTMQSGINLRVLSREGFEIQDTGRLEKIIRAL